MKNLTDFFINLSGRTCQTYDVGNTNPHVGYFNEGKLEKVHSLKLQDIKRENSIVCSVNKEIPSSEVYRKFKGKSFLNMPVHYSESLGHDRLALAYLAYNLLSLENEEDEKNEVVIIDAGTFITMDLVNAGGFQGGHIIPGLKVLGDSFQRGNQLTKVSFKKERCHSWPNNTQDAMNSGLQILTHGLVKQIKELIPTHSKVILTGGQRDFLNAELSADIDEDHLIHYALYYQYVTSQTEL